MAKTTASREHFINFLNSISPKQKKNLTIALRSQYLQSPNFINSLSQKQLGTYTAFWNTHSYVYLGGHNSKNFEIRNNVTQEVFVLKLENNFQPGPVANIGADLRTFLAPKYFHEKIEINKNTSRGIVINDKFSLNDLNKYGKSLGDAEKINASVQLFPQMIDFFISLENNELVMTDAKNANFLVELNTEVNPPQFMIKVADNKSFLPTQNGKVEPIEPFYMTAGHKPPDFYQQTFEASSVHTYILGKNIYKFLSNASYAKLDALDPDPEKWDFSAPIFSTPEGKDLQSLIKRAVTADPKQRISLAEARQVFQKLNPALPQAAVSNRAAPIPAPQPVRAVPPPPSIHEAEALIVKRQECTSLVNEIIKKRLQPDDPLMDEFLKSMAKRITEADKTNIDRLFADVDEIRDSLYSKKVKELMVNIKELADYKQGEILYNALSTTPLNVRWAVQSEPLKDNEIFEIKKAECEQLYNEIIQQKAGPNDAPMNAFSNTMLNKIKNAGPHEIDLVHEELKQVQASVCAVKPKELIQAIKEFNRKSESIFSFGNKTKADLISEALCKIPLNERKNAHTNPEVKKALAYQRFGKGNADPDKNPTTTYRNLMGDIKSAQNPSNDNTLGPTGPRSRNT